MLCEGVMWLLLYAPRGLELPGKRHTREKQSCFVTATDSPLTESTEEASDWSSMTVPALCHTANTEQLPRIVYVFLGTSQGSRWDSALPVGLMTSLEHG